jgi:ribosomal protein S12 methylthiotransferase accessory factor
VIATLPEALRRAVSPYTGIVRSVEECLHTTAEPSLFQASCEIGQNRALLGASLGHVSSVGGTGAGRAEAASAAVGEALERYSATYVPGEKLVVASARELGAAAVAPERFALFSQRQLTQPGFRFRPFDDRARVAWVEGRELPVGGPVYLPAELVYLGPATVAGAQPIGYTTSSGLACAADEVGALVKAAFELLERDAFMIVWANRLSLGLLEPSAAVRRSEAVFRRTGLGVAAVDLSAFHRLPTVLGVVRATAGFPGALGVGAAAAPTIDRAWWKALAEAFAARSAGAKLALLGPRPRTRHDVTAFEDHIRYHADHRRFSAASFLDACSDRVAFDAVAPLEGESPAERLSALCSRVAAAGSTAYAVDVTAPDVAELGLSVARVVAPELCSLDSTHSARFLGGRRLYEAAVALGLRSGPLAERDVNPEPHPFP